MNDYMVRSFEARDAEAVAALLTQSYRGQWVYTAASLLPLVTQPLRMRWVAVRGAQVLATLSAAPLAAEGEPFAGTLRVNVAGDAALFSALYVHLRAWLPSEATRLMAVVREDYSEQMSFYAHLGFRNAWQSWGAHLDLATFDPTGWQPLEEKLFLAGYEPEVFDLHAPATDWAALHALQLQGAADAPRHPITWNTPPTLPQLQEALSSGRQTAFVVRHKGQLVASTLLEPDSAASSVESDLTVTLPPHRHKGVATMLKVYALAWAKRSGFGRASTGGALMNIPMLRVNTALGYQSEAMWVTWELSVMRV